MQYNFSNRFKNLKPSPAGDILAMMGDPTLIKFSGGNPATDSFPIDKITEFTPCNTSKVSIFENAYQHLIQYEFNN